MRSTLLLILCLSFSSASFAQEAVPAPITLKEAAAKTDAKVQGWKPTLTLSGNLSFGSNSDVIGQQDGDTTTLGTNILGGYSYFSNESEWRNNLTVKAATTRTPTLARYVKSNDELKFETLYLYSLPSIPWMGPYVKASVETTLFKGEDIRQTPTTYVFEDLTTTTTSTLRLTDAFKPLTTKESVGAFAKLIDKETMKLETRLGFGAVQVEADGQFAVKDDPTTLAVDVDSLESYEQAGIEGGVTFKGLIDTNTTYTLVGEFLVPIIKDLPPGDDRDSLELTNYDVSAKLTTKLNTWMNLDYEYKLKKQPQLLDKNQIQHILLLNVSYNIF